MYMNIFCTFLCIKISLKQRPGDILKGQCLSIGTFFEGKPVSFHKILRFRQLSYSREKDIKRKIFAFMYILYRFKFFQPPHCLSHLFKCFTNVVDRRSTRSYNNVKIALFCFLLYPFHFSFDLAAVFNTDPLISKVETKVKSRMV